MKKIVSSVVKILLSGLLALVILSVYTYFFNNSGVHVRNPSSATDYKWEPYQRKSTIVEGFAWVTMDGDGYNNRTIPEEIDILLMGSSQMEAVNISQPENTGTLLNELIKNKKTYNIGTSGHTIYTCVQNLKPALACYHPKDWVVLVCDTVILEKEKMNAVSSGNYPKISSYDTGPIYYIQKNFPVIKSLYKCIEDWRKLEESKVQTIETEFNAEYKTAVENFLRKAADAAASEGVELLIVYQPVTKLDSEGEMMDNADSVALQIFQQVCKETNIYFLDMTDDFKKLYDEKHILAHGFINTAVGTGHLNAYGHQIIAAKVTEVIGGKMK